MAAILGSMYERRFVVLSVTFNFLSQIPKIGQLSMILLSNRGCPHVQTLHFTQESNESDARFFFSAHDLSL